MIKVPSLHTMTEYSFLESSIRIDSLISFAKDNGLTSLVITDHNNMFGVAEFVHKCKENGIKPVVGLDLDVEDFRLILLAKNYDGYKELIKYSSEKVNGKVFSRQDILDTNLFVIDHPTQGHYKKYARELHFNNYFVGTKENHGIGVWVDEVRSLYPSDNETLRIIDSLRLGKNILDEYKSKGYDLDVDNSNANVIQVLAIIADCNVEFPTNQNPIPKFKNDDGLASNQFLKKVLNEKAKVLFADKKNAQAYVERLKYEVSIIEQLKFEDYFLIIWDLIRWSKENKILIGPGRGSAAGSLVSYVLGITEIDPLEFDLLFERFLNPERVTMPDIDIDIQDTRRQEVVDYLFKKYGQDNVGLISTFQRLAAKSSIRDVARLMDISVSEATELTKLIPLDMTLDEAYKNSVKFRAAINKSEEYTRLFNTAVKIEGLPRQHGTHAAGIVIYDKPLVTKVPVIRSSEGHNQIQYSMDYLEENGLLKIDLLGLRNLTILQSIQAEIFKNYQRKVDLNKIPLNDKQTNELFSNGDTNGIFQFESYGMKKTLKQVGVSSFDDVVAIVSLFRPGPMDFIPLYADRKQGKQQLDLLSPEYDAIVKPTQGIIVYQEQIMQIAQQFASMSFARADLLRRAIGKKNAALIESLKNEFIKGALSKGRTEDEAKNVYSMIERFADYGFNKSHAVAYATLAYRLAFLKTKFPFEFYTALMESSVGSLTSLQQYVFEAKAKGIEVVAPDINISEEIVINKNKKIILPLIIVKGLGSVANQKIIEERNKKPFVDFFDLVARLKFNGMGESIVLNLIKGNCLRDFGNMQSLIDSLPQATRYAEMITITKHGEKVLDFELLPKPNLLISKSEISVDVKLEKEAYGFNISMFPTSPYELATKLVNVSKGKVVAEIVSLKKVADKNGNEMGIVTLQDSTSIVEAFAFREIFKFIELTKPKTIVKFEIENKDGRYQILSKWEVVKDAK